MGSCSRKLSLYPHGDGKRGGKGHISLYLVLAEASTLPLGQEIRTFFKLFVYDQIRNNYLTVQCMYSSFCWVTNIFFDFSV